ncbi:methyltransferase domain-containing protein [Phytohabitans sp. ZYX-F-186]|uniref:Methyltransferase domain-containing protein n=1 Tax=Phytohabitans maris TaxID=3071409 RepID=A0ABU0ZWD2_9ACTN|nr:methyltransferase domain-containing protein [Phytohabitans sp. ZYX-F-186]MDQ7911243.1 methyltransferase domain-containing protein [Phytohabitans sp. ZYX-F-186]
MTAFATAYAARPATWLVDERGERVRLPLGRWHGPAEPSLRTLLDRCAGPALDVGCGPGRAAAELASRGLVALGIDTCPAAVRLARRRGAAALRRSVFAPLPGEGRWAHALLLDGNIGIGGDPVALLRRCAQVLRPGGTVLVEVDAPGAGLWRGSARLLPGPAFAWARVGVEAVGPVAARAGLTLRAVSEHDGRWFAELARP